MNIPKIKFKIMSLEDNIDTIKWAFYENDDNLSVHSYTIEYFKELSLLDINGPKEKVNKTIEKVVTKYYYMNKDKLLSEVERYNKIWNKYNDKYLKVLSEFLEINFPRELEEIDAYVGLIPIFPRYLDSFSFSIGPDLEDLAVIEVASHETLHFLWFLKWKKLHPETKRNHYDSPYIEWKYSEMVTDPILNNKPFSNFLPFKEKSYDSFYELYDDNELVMDKLRKIYSNDSNIDTKIEEGFNYIKSTLK